MMRTKKRKSYTIVASLAILALAAVEHRVGRDDLGAMRQLGVIPDELPGPGAAP